MEPGYREALDQLQSTLVLFRGIELNFDPLSPARRQGDRRPARSLWVLNHPARYKLSVAETVERIADHPARRAGQLAAIEVTDTGFYRPIYDTDEIPLVKIATDDAHRPPHFGRAWIEVDAPRDRDAIIRAIRAGEFRIGFAER